MSPTQDYKQLLTQVIKKQIVILGPDITLAKARNVSGLVVADDGTVTDISGDQQQITQKLIDQFVQLSGEIVKKTMEPLLMANQTPVAGLIQTAPQTVPVAPVQPVTQMPTTAVETPSQPIPQSFDATQDQRPVANQPVAQDAKSVQ